MNELEYLKDKYKYHIFVYSQDFSKSMIKNVTFIYWNVIYRLWVIDNKKYLFYNFNNK